MLFIWMRASSFEYDGRPREVGSHGGLLFTLLASIQAGYLCLFKRHLQVGYGVTNEAGRKNCFFGCWRPLAIRSRGCCRPNDCFLNKRASSSHSANHRAGCWQILSCDFAVVSTPCI